MSKLSDANYRSNVDVGPIGSAAVLRILPKNRVIDVSEVIPSFELRFSLPALSMA